MDSLSAQLGGALTVSTGRKILIADFDLFRDVGGGQTVYKRIIALRPHDQFFYFRRLEAPEALRPSNARPITFQTFYWADAESLSGSHLHLLWSYRDCRNMAISVREAFGNIDFDVVDVPDYTQNGVFIRAALRDEGIDCGLVALSMHGTLSGAWGRGWPTSNLRGPTDGLREREIMQYATADARYAISERYAAEWSAISPMAANPLDPMCIVMPRSGLKAPAFSSQPPDLVYIGRREKYKGPDLFLDIAWCVDPGNYRRLMLAGPDGPNEVGIGSTSFLDGMSKLRQLPVEVLGSLSRTQIDEIFASRSLIFLPSRYDTFNLTALEATLMGCPVIVSRAAGISRWFAKHLPGLPWMVVDIDCSRSAAAVISNVLSTYDQRRDEITRALQRLPPVDSASVDRIYDPQGKIDVDARQMASELATFFYDFARLTPRTGRQRLAESTVLALRRAGSSAVGLLPARLRLGLSRLELGIRTAVRLRRHGGLHWGTKEYLKRALRDATGISPRTFLQLDRSRRREVLRQQILADVAAGPRAASAKLLTLSSRVADHLVNRVPIFREMIRLERQLGRDLTAATYALRVMRWAGKDEYGDLPFVAATLEAHGYPHEAAAAQAMFGNPAEADARCLDLMRDAYERNRHKQRLPLAELDDRRGATPRRVSVIVSLYNAATKLPTLLRCLANQTIVRSDDLEVILVDSNSPADEKAAMEGFLATQPLPVVYARSAQRETIQQAWNRGITLARTPYLAFLGADEGLHPDALSRLAAALDGDPQADWAMADSIVTDVDANGVYVGDIMPYDRTGYRQDLVYLDTCYLSWVGGLYRRSIHDRFGYYDETYRAAGDTEFKNRVMPHIRSIHVPQMLGVFNNYPEERTTASPRAEIEDLRAWYLWRTAAGMRYAFEGRPAEDAIALLRLALSYRKSFCGHISTDFDLADALASYIATRPDVPAAMAAQMKQATAAALASLRDLDRLPHSIPNGPRGLQTALHVFSEIRTAHRQVAERHQALFDLPARPHYEVFNDNRYEQHWWSWSGP